jgi:hypothetical protein
MEKVQPKENIISRHEAFASSIKPRKQIYFFPAPDLVEIFPSNVRKVIEASKDIFLDYTKNQSSITHIEIDYKKCGVSVDDFWFDSIKIFDPAHPNAFAKAKITECMIDALAARINQIEKNRP